jgi:hypothetical protein
MAEHTKAFVLTVCVVLLTQVIVGAFRIHGSFRTHWAIVMIPIWFLELLSFFAVARATASYYNKKAAHQQIWSLLSMWLTWGCTTTFAILLSLELNDRNTFSTFVLCIPLFVLFGGICAVIILDLAAKPHQFGWVLDDPVQVRMGGYHRPSQERNSFGRGDSDRMRGDKLYD